MNIWVNGCFDILHTGHMDLLWYAKLYNTKGYSRNYAVTVNHLYVGIDTDDRVKMLKGNKRPINDIYSRVKMVANLKMVDSVVSFHDDKELIYFINKFKIDYMVIGDQYKDKIIVGAEYTKSGVIYYPTDGRSTTNIINKIKAL
jgi:D-beta-D-heptose 7-phosphate kinase/D-beta-D-heptose 1-phosphate adenosyltransferase